MIREYPEVDRAGWFDLEQAKKKILKGQAGFIDRLIDALDYSPKMKSDMGHQASTERHTACTEQLPLTRWLED